MLQAGDEYQKYTYLHYFININIDTNYLTIVKETYY